MCLFFVPVVLLLLSSCTRDDAGGSGRLGGGIDFSVTCGSAAPLTKSGSSEATTYELYYNLTGGIQSDSPISSGSSNLSAKGSLSSNSASSSSTGQNMSEEPADDFNRFTISIEPNDGIYRYSSFSSSVDSRAGESSDPYSLSSSTHYGDKVKDGSNKTIHEYIVWDAGDEFAIWSDVARNSNGQSQEVYSIMSSPTNINNESKATITPKSAGLNWVGSGTHKFVGIYPVSGAVTTESNSRAYKDFNLSSTQTVTQVAAGSNNYLPDLSKYGFMSAYTSSSPVNSLGFRFSPKFSAIEFSLKSESGVEMALKGVTISSTDSYLASKGSNFNYRVGYNVSTSTHILGFTSATDTYCSKEVSLSFLDNEGNSTIPTINSTTETSFTILLSGATALTNLTVTFDVDITVGGSTEIGKKRILKLTSGGSPITIPACSKVLISNLNLPKDTYDYKFIVTDPTDIGYTAATSTTAKIESYKTMKSDPTTKIAVGWSVEKDGDEYVYYESLSDAQNGTNKKNISASGSFLTGVTPPSSAAVESNLGIGYAAGNPDPAQSESFSGEKFNDAINSKSPIGSSTNYINLSNPSCLASPYTPSDDIIESANTYIVNGAGYYRIPLVMGNGVKNNGLNENAYKQSGFVNYMGDAMTSRTTPYLQDNSRGATGVPTSAYIVWADKNFIEVENTTNWVIKSGSTTINAISSTTSGGQQVYWLNFHVNDPSSQAVAVIGIRDQNSTTMWSYTIWLTDYVPFNYPGYDAATNKHKDVEVTSYSDASNPEGTPLKVTLMPRHIGWVELSTSSYSTGVYNSDEAYIKLIQDGTNAVQILKVSRDSGPFASGDRYGYFPYYQWGRKDALLPSNGTGNTNLSAVGVNRTLTAATSTTLANVIKNPHLGYGNTTFHDWTTSVNNLGWWCAGNNETSVDKATVKTIYDPSPAGYVVPRRNAFTAFIIGTSGYTPNSLAFQRGYYFHNVWSNTTAGTGATSTIFFPAGGYWAFGDAVLLQVGKAGFYWNSMPDSGNTASYLSFQSGYAGMTERNWRPFGFGLRCQRDEYYAAPGGKIGIGDITVTPFGDEDGGRLNL